MPQFPPTVDELLEEFQEMEDWDERYDFIIDLGRELPPLDPADQAEENIVHGCMSTVWLVTKISDEEEKRVEIKADSDSIIVKGLIVIMMAYYNGRTAQEILQEDVTGLFEQLGLTQHLSPQRRNGLFSMIKRLKQLALEHQTAA